MRTLSIAFILLAAVVNAQPIERSNQESLADQSSRSGFIAWRSGVPEFERPFGKVAKNSNSATINIRSLKEDLKGIGVVALTNDNISRLSVQFNSYAKHNMLIQLVDKSGKVMHSQYIMIDSDDEDYFLDISSFSANHYKLVLTDVMMKRMSVYVLERDRKI